MHAPQIHLAHTVFDEPVNGLLNLTFLEVPVTRKVVQHAIGNHPQRDGLTLLTLHFHQTVHRIVEGRVTPHDDDGLVAVIDEHTREALHAVSGFALHKVILHLA